MGAALVARPTKAMRTFDALPGLCIGVFLKASVVGLRIRAGCEVSPKRRRGNVGYVRNKCGASVVPSSEYASTTLCDLSADGLH